MLALFRTEVPLVAKAVGTSPGDLIRHALPSLRLAERIVEKFQCQRAVFNCIVLVKQFPPLAPQKPKHERQHHQQRPD